jgi:hypothetical protein
MDFFPSYSQGQITEKQRVIMVGRLAFFMLHGGAPNIKKSQLEARCDMRHAARQ